MAMKQSRRKFLEKAASASLGAGVFSIIPSKVWSSPIAPSDQVNIALIGCNGHGFGVLRHHLNVSGTNCVGICDVDQQALQRRIAEVKRDYDQEPEAYGDFRRLLERKDLDAVIIASPDHWHCLHMVMACEAGKDVYVEKPLANTIGECKLMTDAAVHYKRVVQVGQQQRSGKTFQDALQLVKDGRIGQLRKINIWANFEYGLGAIPAEDTAVPAGVDYDFWLGPAPKRPFNKNRFHGSWRHFWDYGGGLMSDWGVHLLDMAMWVLPEQAAPSKVLTVAANLSAQKRARDTFDTMSVTYAHPQAIIQWDMTAGLQQGPYEKAYGVAYIGEKGTLVVDRKSYQLFPEWDGASKAPKTDPVLFTEGKESHNFHAVNFLECVKSREEPVCPPELGRKAALYAHIPNIAGRVGEPILDWDDSKQLFTNSAKANELIFPSYRRPWALPKFG
jgi:predicted dehydrogenase